MNLGNHTFSTRKVITDMVSGVSAGAAVRWADINGNGTTDLVYADSQSTPHIRAVDLIDQMEPGAQPADCHL